MKNKVIGVLMAVVMAAGLIGCSPAVNQGGDEGTKAAEAVTEQAEAVTGEKPVIKFGFTGGEIEEQAYRRMDPVSGHDNNVGESACADGSRNCTGYCCSDE